LKSSDKEWAKNHFKLIAVTERQEELEKMVTELKQQNDDLKKEMETLRTTPPAVPIAAQTQAQVAGFN
jgi:hypothetical protein